MSLAWTIIFEVLLWSGGGVLLVRHLRAKNRKRRPKADPYKIAKLEYQLGFSDEPPVTPLRFGPGAVIPYQEPQRPVFAPKPTGCVITGPRSTRLLQHSHISNITG